MAMIEFFIICDERRVEFAEQLQSLISADSDIVAVVLLQKEFEASRMKFSSENYKLFLGDYPAKKEYMKQLNNKAESAEYGTFIGQQGRVSLIQVDVNYKRILKDKKKYEQYLALTKDYLIGVGFLTFVGIFAPIGWGVQLFLHYRAKRKIQKQLYVGAITEYYRDYLKSFIGIESNE